MVDGHPALEIARVAENHNPRGVMCGMGLGAVAKTGEFCFARINPYDIIKKWQL
jgi:hypothetical protein